ncbi:MAG: hypothetical protein MK085_07815 [Phycisphaerales bacterium]|nr:hypothetical protein [Phycisphaerales bacterium]
MHTQELTWGSPDMGRPFTDFNGGDVESETTLNAVRLTPPGPLLDSETAHATIEAATRLTSARSGSLRRLIVDMREIVVPSSLVVGMLLEIARISESEGLKPIIHGSNAALSELLGMLQLDRRYTMSASQRELDRAMAA